MGRYTRRQGDESLTRVVCDEQRESDLLAIRLQGVTHTVFCRYSRALLLPHGWMKGVE